MKRYSLMVGRGVSPRKLLPLQETARARISNSPGDGTQAAGTVPALSVEPAQRMLLKVPMSTEVILPQARPVATLFPQRYRRSHILHGERLPPAPFTRTVEQFVAE